jgi:hypothetical protein
MACVVLAATLLASIEVGSMVVSDIQNLEQQGLVNLAAAHTRDRQNFYRLVVAGVQSPDPIVRDATRSVFQHLIEDDSRRADPAAQDGPGENPRLMLALLIVIGLLPLPAFIAGMFFDRQRVIDAVARRLTSWRRRRTKTSFAKTQPS